MSWVAAGVASMLALAGCSDGGDNGAAQSGGDAGAADTAMVSDAVADVGPSADALVEDMASTEDVPPTEDAPSSDASACGFCAPGTFCDELTAKCVDCLVDDHCTYPSWCKAGACIETTCFPDQKACDGLTPKECAHDGSKWIEGAECPADGACVAGDCKDKVCDPGQKQCSKLQIQVCDEWGTGFAHVPCPPGSACYTEQCEPIKHNVVLIFDTSGSMGSIGALDAVPCICASGCKTKPYPACEDLACPQSRLGLAKKVFNEIFASEVFKRVQFAMLRFPQREKADSPETCGSLLDPTGIGHYTNLSSAGGNSDWITGDDNSHIPADGGWFEQGLAEILSVPFPVDEADDTTPKAKEWVDGDEVFEKIGPACQKNVDCPVGVCALNKQTGEGECATHTNHELRATGGTPLGKSLFYAGEYLRKYGVPQGKACETDADCGNINYFCGPQKTCFDPLRGCRQNIVILFTDGVESPATVVTDFFNPAVQAKRLHYGLGCAFHSDCAGGAKCKTGSCQEYNAPSPILLIDGAGGANRLTDYEGNSIAATVHVVDISQGSSESSNQAIALHGGGIFFPVSNGDPEALLDSINSILDVKANISQCIPQFPEGWVE